MTADERTDEELRRLAGGGDAEAFQALKDRHFDNLYDFAVRISLDPALAAQAAGAAFDRVLASPPGSLPLATALLAAARDEALERMRGRGRSDDSADEPRAPISPVDPMFSRAEGVDPELAGWAWQAARAQRPRDYSLLDLSVRRGVPADEIAEATDMSHSGIYAILGRLRGAFEESFTSTLLYHRGREACDDLDALIRGQGAPGPALRREIARHVEGCADCRRTRRAFPSPADLLAAFLPVPPSTPAAPGATAAEALQASLPLASAAAADAPAADAAARVAAPGEPLEGAAEPTGDEPEAGPVDAADEPPEEAA